MFTVAGNTVRSETQTFGTLQTQRAEALCQQSQDEDHRATEHLAPRCEEAQEAVTYFTNQAHRMPYDQFRAAGYLMGSSTVESGCKQIVTQRLKQPGAQWTMEGAVLTAKARAAWLSGDWEVLCAQRAALSLAV